MLTELTDHRFFDAELQRRAKLLYTEADIEAAIQRIAQRINHDYQGRTPIILVVMTGAVPFAGRLLPQLSVPLELDYCHVSRYDGAMRGDALDWRAYPALNLHERDVIVVDDILDEGITLHAILDFCHSQGVASVRSAVLIDKEHDRKAFDGQHADYCELSAPDEYLFGYGMDYRRQWRNAKEIYALISHDPH